MDNVYNYILKLIVIHTIIYKFFNQFLTDPTYRCGSGSKKNLSVLDRLTYAREEPSAS